jgi:hypothetical protein
VNLRADDWRIGDYTLPQFGFLARGAGLLAYTARRDGIIVDYARTPKSLFVDSRSEVALPWTNRQKRVEPGVKDFEYLGGDKFRIAYQWQVNDRFTRDLHCFVHFQDMQSQDAAKGIVFQNDHRLPRPTTEWKPGLVLTDGPYTVTVPETSTQNELYILVGLFKGNRVPLNGVSAGAQRIAVGRLLLTRKNGKITNITLAGIDALRREQTAKRKRFMKRTNVAGIKIHFGQAVTDGSFKLLVKPAGLDVLPFPRDRKFRIELDLAALAPGRFGKRVEIVGLDAAKKELTKATLPVKDGKLAFSAGTPGVTQYRIR